METPDGADIFNGGYVNWVRPSAVTHTKNMNQRINGLAFVEAVGGLNVMAPSEPNACPPGYYMLFLINSNGVPSVASWIKVTGAPPCPPPPDAVSVHVSSITVSTVNVGGGNRIGLANVVIRDDQNNPVAGATVTGTFTGEFNETVSETTDATGTAVLQTIGTTKGKVKNLMFCVDDVMPAGELDYDPADNVVVCADIGGG